MPGSLAIAAKVHANDASTSRSALRSRSNLLYASSGLKLRQTNWWETLIIYLDVCIGWKFDPLRF
jgi:hypothetical protein